MITQEEMNVLVPEKLKEIEEKYDVEVLWAVESGSRAWGFASPDSDFDVRFIYRRKWDSYYRLDAVRDVIEEPVDEVWDLNGWDLDKTLKLLHNSNPTLYEWLNSPIVYKTTIFRDRVIPLLKEYFSVKKMMYHYLNTAKGNKKANLSKDKIKPKKYFYVIRPLLACRWIYERRKAPPVLFDTLVKEYMPEELMPSLNYLLDIKMNNPEKSEISHVADLDEFIDKEIAKYEAILMNMNDEDSKSWDLANELFKREVYYTAERLGRPCGYLTKDEQVEWWIRLREMNIEIPQTPFPKKK